MIHYKKGALIYIEHIYNEKLNKAINQNYNFIQNVFERIDIPFVYLPKLLIDSHFNKVLKYNHPYLKESHHNHTNKLYHVINNSLNLTIDGPTLIHLSNNGDVTHQFPIPTSEVFSSPKLLVLFLDNIRHKISPIIKDDEESIRFRTTKETIFSSFDLFNESFDSLLDEPATPSKKDIQLSKSYEKKELKEKTAENLFEEQAFNISHDLKQQIKELSEAGYLSHLIKYLEILQQATRKLSRLKISADYKMYLMDYEMKEVIMSPLPKALYLMFLNHPQGISFKELPEYRAELMEIYKNISLRENPIKARISIKKLTDPFDNSVHEKCSRIREAFLRVVAEDIAENYYITGGKGEVKKVILDRELLVYDR